MKCIKTIKKTNSREIGEVIRIEETEAENKVKTGYWAYCPKSEWKELTRRVKTVSKKETEEVSEDRPSTKRGKRRDEK